jgi:hypothetical protein
MHKLDPYGRVINEYGQEMGFNNYYPNWNYPDMKNNPCAEIDLVQERIRQTKEKENKHKYILIRR